METKRENKFRKLIISSVLSAGMILIKDNYIGSLIEKKTDEEIVSHKYTVMSDEQIDEFIYSSYNLLNKYGSYLSKEENNEWQNKTNNEFFNYELDKIDILNKYIKFDFEKSKLDQIYDYCVSTVSSEAGVVKKDIGDNDIWFNIKTENNSFVIYLNYNGDQIIEVLIIESDNFGNSIYRTISVGALGRKVSLSFRNENFYCSLSEILNVINNYEYSLYSESNGGLRKLNGIQYNFLKKTFSELLEKSGLDCVDMIQDIFKNDKNKLLVRGK